VTPAPQGFPGPIFVGGPGRSGTHVMGRLIAAHPRYHMIRTEARFHASSGGLPDLLAGRVGMKSFLESMRGHWWKRGPRQNQGLQRIATKSSYEAALAAFEAGFDDDPWGASRALVDALLGAAAQSDGKPSWVEVTGDTIQEASTLLRLYPEGRLINMVRDGRAVVAGTLNKTNLTDDPMKALAKWERMVRAADVVYRSAPAGTMLVMPLDHLVALDRERSFRRLVEFLEVDDEEPMRNYHEKRISAERAHVGRWRERMAPADARLVDRRYRRLVRRLHRSGIAWAPAPEGSAGLAQRVRVAGGRVSRPG
jgi:hypothetical protein